MICISTYSILTIVTPSERAVGLHSDGHLAGILLAMLSDRAAHRASLADPDARQLQTHSGPLGVQRIHDRMRKLRCRYSHLPSLGLGESCGVCHPFHPLLMVLNYVFLGVVSRACLQRWRSSATHGIHGGSSNCKFIQESITFSLIVFIHAGGRMVLGNR